jgi:hypothetical protein
MLFTVSSFSLSERMAFTEASAAERLVAWEIFWAMAVERIWTSLWIVDSHVFARKDAASAIRVAISLRLDF